MIVVVICEPSVTNFCINAFLGELMRLSEHAILQLELIYLIALGLESLFGLFLFHRFEVVLLQIYTRTHRLY